MSVFISAKSKAVVLCCVVLCCNGCKQIVPSADTPKLINDTGINVTVTFNPNGGTWQDGTGVEIKKVGNCGSLLPSPGVPEKTNLIFAGWNTEGQTLPATFPAYSTVYKAVYRQLGSDEAFYTVEYFQEKTDASGFELCESCKKSGKTGKSPVYEIKAFAGFDYSPTDSAIPTAIDGSGTTKVKLQYKRKDIRITLELNGGTMTPPSSPNVLSGKFGASVPQVKNPAKPGFDFAGWNATGGTVPTTFPAEDKTYKALWTKGNIIKNADFSQTEVPSGHYAVYWKPQKSPVDWTAKGKKNIAGVEFRVENAAFSVTAGSTLFENTGGIEQTVVLPDTTNGTTYKLSVKMKIEKKTNAGGGALVRLGGKPVLKKYSGIHHLDKKIMVKGTNIEFTDDSDNPVSVPLNGRTHNQLKLELCSIGIKNLSVMFSDIKCIQE